MSLSRRQFLVGSAAAGASLFLVSYAGGVRTVRAVALPGGTLDPQNVPKFVTPMLIPPVMPRAGTIKLKGGKNADYYEISMRQFDQQILPAENKDGEPLGMTTVWGYGGKSAQSNRGLLIHNAPSLTIEAKWNRPVRVKWINELVDENGDYLPHLLPVDPTLHWANPPGGPAGRDSRPTFTSTPGPYTGPVPIVTHVHGSAGVQDDSDGYAEAWYLPNLGDNLPDGYADRGTWYDFFAGKAATNYGVTWGAGFAIFQYPNSQRASTIWYHDHALGMTRLNVYAGPAGFFIIRGGPAGDEAVLDSRTGTRAVLPGPAPREGDKFPPNKPYREIPIAIQDRSFNDDGSLFYPDTREFFDGITEYVPDTDISPIWNPEFFGNTIMVNGNTWPYLDVEQRRYRFRFLNGCDSRFLILDFGNMPGVEAWMIGNEGGFLAAPVNLMVDNGSRLLIGIAERADVIVDFTNVPLGSYILGNVGPDEPFAGGVPGDEFLVADPATTGQIMQFNVGAATSPDPTTPPQYLVPPAITPLPTETVTRPLALLEKASDFFDAPAETRLGTIEGDPNAGSGVWTPLQWEDPVTENPDVGVTEMWELYNATVDAHPIHIHEVLFQVVNRQPIDVNEASRTVAVVGSEIPPEPWENGWKDTVIAYPGQVTRVRMKFNTPGQFVWHCHIVSHEDNEMMRPYRIGPVQDGEPGS